MKNSKLKKRRRKRNEESETKNYARNEKKKRYNYVVFMYFNLIPRPPYGKSMPLILYEIGLIGTRKTPKRGIRQTNARVEG